MTRRPQGGRESFEESDSSIGENDQNLSSLNPLVTPGLADTSQNRCSLFEANNPNSRSLPKFQLGSSRPVPQTSSSSVKRDSNQSHVKESLTVNQGSQSDLQRSRGMVKLNNPYDTNSI